METHGDYVLWGWVSGWHHLAALFPGADGGVEAKGRRAGQGHFATTRICGACPMWTWQSRIQLVVGVFFFWVRLLVFCKVFAFFTHKLDETSVLAEGVNMMQFHLGTCTNLCQPTWPSFFLGRSKGQLQMGMGQSFLAVASSSQQRGPKSEVVWSSHLHPWCG